MTLDPNRRYYWRPLHGCLTAEDDAIIQTRGIPTVDQERALYYELRLDGKFQCRQQAQKRKAWRKRRELTGTIGEATWAGL